MLSHIPAQSVPVIAVARMLIVGVVTVQFPYCYVVVLWPDTVGSKNGVLSRRILVRGEVIGLHALQLSDGHELLTKRADTALIRTTVEEINHCRACPGCGP